MECDSRLCSPCPLRRKDLYVIRLQNIIRCILVCIVSHQASHSVDYTCYRQSIDLYGSVPSPSLNFLGTPTLSRLSSSFLSSSLTRRQTPEILPSLNEPLVPAADDEKLPQQRRSSHSLLPPTPSRKPNGIKKVTPDEKASKVSHELPISRQSSYGQAVVNGMLVRPGIVTLIKCVDS